MFIACEFPPLLPISAWETCAGAERGGLASGACGEYGKLMWHQIIVENVTK